jgi:uncharacterized protein YgbK (DUF1537 family)
MARCAIVADDLTGANTAGVLLTKAGLRILTIVQDSAICDLSADDYDGVVVNAMSRTVSPDSARLILERDTKALIARGGEFFCKRIDSTIRGNLGAEVEGMLTALGTEYIAICVPSYPASGKITIGGYLLLNAVPIARTIASKDPLKPVRNSYLPDVFAEQTELQSAVIPLATVTKGTEAIISSLREVIGRGARIVVIDSANDNDIELIARAVVESGIKAVSVDPGPFTQALFPRYISPKRPPKKAERILVVAGSISELTRAQLDHLEKQCGARLVSVDVRHFLEGECDVEVERALACAASEASRDHSIFGFRVVETSEMVLDLDAEARARSLTLDDISQRITRNLANLARKTIELAGVQIKGVYLTGGDLTVAFCNALGASAIELEDEIIPHISYGALRGGPYDGLKVTTKGGFIGVADTAWHCIKYMTQH